MSNSTVGAIPAPYGNSTTSTAVGGGAITAGPTKSMTQATMAPPSSTALVSQLSDGQPQATSAAPATTSVAPYAGGAGRMAVEGVVGAAALFAGIMMV
jgi:hypothetical protein